MRRLWLLALVASGGLGCVENVQNVVAVNVQAPRCDDDAFAKRLETWGSWSDDETYGTVWTPSDAEFVPFATDGYFADLGGEMVWLSDRPWGETLHRGWWVHSRKRWRWVPGRARSGAVVRWVHDGDRTAWAPTAPPRIWRHGREQAIAPRNQPLVGVRKDDELAVTVLGAPKSDDEPDATQDDEQLRSYAHLAADVKASGEEAVDELTEDDGFDGAGGGGGRGGRGAAAHGAAHGSSSATVHGGGVVTGVSASAAAGHH